MARPRRCPVDQTICGAGCFMREQCTDHPNVVRRMMARIDAQLLAALARRAKSEGEGRIAGEGQGRARETGG